MTQISTASEQISGLIILFDWLIIRMQCITLLQYIVHWARPMLQEQSGSVHWHCEPDEVRSVRLHWNPPLWISSGSTCNWKSLLQRFHIILSSSADLAAQSTKPQTSVVQGEDAAAGHLHIILSQHPRHWALEPMRVRPPTIGQHPCCTEQSGSVHWHSELLKSGQYVTLEPPALNKFG